MGTEPILSLLIKLAIPSVIGMATQAIYNVVDSIYVGHISKDALSAVTLAFPIQMILIAIAMGTSVGVTSLISRSLGGGDRKQAGLAAEHALFVSVLLSIVVGLAGALFSVPITKIFTSDPLMIELTSRYIRIIMIGSFGLFIPQILQGIQRGEGNTMTPMVIMAISAVLNIILDPILIFGIGRIPALGVEGAAYATVLARILGGAVLALIMMKGKREVEFSLKGFSFQPSILGNIYSVGFPAMAMQLLGSIMLAVANLIIARHDATAIAAYGIYYRLQSFIFMPVFGIGQAVLPLIGYNYGNKDYERIRKTVWYGMLSAVLFTCIGFALFQLFPRELIVMFNDSPDLVLIGITALKRISLGILLVGPTIISANIFQALGKGAPSLVISVLRNLVILLPVMFLLGELGGISSLWFAFPISELVSFFLSVFWLSRILKGVRGEIGEMRKVTLDPARA